MTVDNMNIDIAFQKMLTQMPEELKKEVLHYAIYLLSQYSDNKSFETISPQQQRSRDLQATILLPLPEEVNSSLKSLNTDTKAAYEKKYGYGSLTGKIVVPEDFDEPLEDFKDYM